jgi:hypothetical protein
LSQLLGAALVVAGGVLHLQMWLDHYRHVPSTVPGSGVVRWGFPIDAAGSAIIAIAVIVAAGRQPWVLAFAAVSQAAAATVLVASRHASVFGWTEHGWANDAKEAIMLEAAALATLAAALVVHHTTVPNADARTAGDAAAR